MPAEGRYINAANVSARLGVEKYHLIFDDDLDGVADDAVVQEYVDDAESELEQSIAKTYGDEGLLALRDLGTDCPRAVKKLCLDLLVVAAYQRHPSYIRAEWVKREQSVQERLKELRLREVQLDTTAAPEPAVGESEEVRGPNPDDPTTIQPPTFIGNRGSF